MDPFSYLLDFMNATSDLTIENYQLPEYSTVPPVIVAALRQYVTEGAFVLYRGFSFETELEAHKFDSGIAVQERLSSWTTNKEVARDYASNLQWGVIVQATLGSSSVLVEVQRTSLAQDFGFTDDEVLVFPGTYVVQPDIFAVE